MPPDQRDFEMIALRQKGATLAEIGEKYDLTRQRVHAIIKKTKIWAQQISLKAVNSGELIRPGRCSECDAECFPDGHHEDYSKPLEVVWLCRECHSKKHASNKSLGHEDRPIKEKAREKNCRLIVLVEPKTEDEINNARGGLSMSGWIRDAIEMKLTLCPNVDFRFSKVREILVDPDIQGVVFIRFGWEFPSNPAKSGKIESDRRR